MTWQGKTRRALTNQDVVPHTESGPSRSGSASAAAHSPSLTVTQQGFDAWRRGDFDALEAILAPDVEWRWFEPGDWDCHSRDDVMRTLRQRHAAGFAEGRLSFHDAGSDAVVVTAHPREIGGPEWPAETSTVIRFHQGKVVSMQDYRTEAEALAAAE